MVETLDADQSNWRDKIKKRTQELFRDGDATTFDEAVKQIMREVARDASAQQAKNGMSNGNGRSSTGTNSLAIPQSVIQEGLKVTNQALDQVVAQPDDEA